MRHLRLILVCTMAALAASCSDSNPPSPSSPETSSTSKPFDGTQTCSSIGDKVFLDENCDGIQNKDEAGQFTEPGVADVVVNLYTCDGDFVATTTTNADGAYLFEVSDVLQDYRVCFVLPDGYEFSPANVGSEGGDSDAGPDGCTSCFTGGECKVIRNIDAGLCRVEEPCPSSIGDRVWLDENCDGIQDKEPDGDFTEPGVAGVVVNLYTCDGAFVATTTTDANGAYLFDVSDEVQDYRVCFVLPDGYKFSPANVGSEGGDSDAGADGCTSCFTGGECKVIRNIDAGLCREEEPCPSSIGDRVWLDENCDGIQDKEPDGDFTEPGVGGVVVNLYTCDGDFVATTTTDANGAYLFDVSDEVQDYRVCFELPDGYKFSPANQGSEGGDSDAGADGCTSCFTGGECKVIRNIDAGLCREEEGEGEYCSPGFWKNHYTHWGPTGYSPSDIFDDVFDCDLFGDDTTLGEAIHIEDTHNPLAFHAVAALLNASHPDIDINISVSDVQDAVCDRDKSRLEDFNENCPLSGGNTNGGGGGKKK
jgi:hypothetical protein